MFHVHASYEIHHLKLSNKRDIWPQKLIFFHYLHTFMAFQIYITNFLVQNPQEDIAAC